MGSGENLDESLGLPAKTDHEECGVQLECCISSTGPVVTSEDKEKNFSAGLKIPRLEDLKTHL